MSRSVAIVLWVFVWHIVPALCVLGVVAHPCDCGETADCESGHDCGPGDPCRHEANCADDPCSTFVIRPEREDNDPTARAQAPTALADFRSDGFDRPTLAHPHSSAVSPLPRKLPYPPSDLPLLL